MTIDPSLDDDLRAWGASARAEAPAPSLPPLRRGPDRRVLAAIGAAVVVLVAAVAVPVVTRHHHTSSGGYQPLPTLQPGMQFATQHGLLVQVPESWARDAVACGVPLRNTIIDGYEPRPLCAGRVRPGISTVEFAETTDLQNLDIVSGGGGGVPSWGPIRHTTLGKTRVDERAGRAGDLQVEQIMVPSLRVTITIASPARSTVDRIADSARIVARDPAGCANSTHTSPRLRRDAAPVRNGAGTTLIPDGATSVRVCAYAAGLLRSGTQLTGPALTGLVSTLDAAPSGVSVADPADYASDLCPADRGIGDPFDPRSEDAEWAVLTARFASGPNVTVTARLGLCGDLGAANGSYSVQRTEAVFDVVTALTSLTVGPGAVEPRH